MKLDKEYLLELTEKKENICIHTETQEQWNEIIDVLEDYKGSITSSTFKKYPEICLDFSGYFLKFSKLEYFQYEGFKILSYEDICTSTEETTTLELDKDFLIAQRGKHVVVNCKTQEEWNNIVSVLEDNIPNYWNNYTENTCLNLHLENLSYGSIDYHKNKGSKILFYEDCCKKEIKEELKTINIRIGDEIGKLIINKKSLELLKNGERIRVI